MALTGKITDWSLADILQMVATERKSGVLTLESEDEDEARFHFREGNLTSAHDRRPSAGTARGRAGRGIRASGKGAKKAGASRVSFGSQGGLPSYLNATGRIDRQKMTQLLKSISSEGDEFEAARRAALLPPAALEEAITEYAQDLVHRVLTWPVGDYNFVAGHPQQPASNLTLSTEGLLLEAMRRIDEAPGIQDLVRHDTVFRRCPEAVPPADLKPREAAMLAVVDGVQPAGKLARAAGLADHDAAKSLYRLNGMRLVEPLIPAFDESPVLDLSVEELMPVRRWTTILRLASLLLLFGVSFYFRDLTHRPGAAAPITADHEPRLVEGVRFAREVFREAYGREAMSAMELRRAGLLPSGFWGEAAQALFAAETAPGADRDPSIPSSP